MPVESHSGSTSATPAVRAWHTWRENFYKYTGQVDPSIIIHTTEGNSHLQRITLASLSDNTSPKIFFTQWLVELRMTGDNGERVHLTKLVKPNNKLDWNKSRSKPA